MQTVTSAENGGTGKADFQVPIQILSKTDLTHTGNITQLDTTGKLVTTSILVLPILIINGEIRSHSGSGKRGGICLLPEFTMSEKRVAYS